MFLSPENHRLLAEQYKSAEEDNVDDDDNKDDDDNQRQTNKLMFKGWYTQRKDLR